MQPHINVSVTVLGWVVLALGGGLLLASVLLGWGDHGCGGLYLGMLGGILAMRGYMFAAFAAGRELGRNERQDDWFDMGREVGRLQERESREGGVLPFR